MKGLHELGTLVTATLRIQEDNKRLILSLSHRLDLHSGERERRREGGRGEREGGRGEREGGGKRGGNKAFFFKVQTPPLIQLVKKTPATALAPSP